MACVAGNPAKPESFLLAAPWHQEQNRTEQNRIEVINAAVGGWRSREGLLRLQEQVRSLNPDLLLVAFNWNDFGMAMKGHDPDKVIFPKKPWWQHIKIFENLKIRYLVSREHNEDYISRRRSRIKRDEEWVRALTRHILAMKRVADEINADVMLVNLPGLCRTKLADSNEIDLVVERTRVTRENFPLWAELKDFETELFREIGRDHGIQVIDVHQEFERFSGAQRLELFTDEMHMTARGTYETAAAIARALGQAAAAESRP